MRRFPPLAADHPLVGRLCLACGRPFDPGDETTLVLLGPGADPEERQRRDEGRPYNSIGGPIHWACSPQDAGE